jgi:hypothetical protein
MATSHALAKNFLAASGYTFAVLSGVFLGISSCGGYAWHTVAAQAALAGFALLIAFFPPTRASSAIWRVAFGLGVFVAWYFARALALPLDLDSEVHSLSDYFSLVWMGLELGPC